MSRVEDRRDYERVTYERDRDRDRRGDERTRNDDDDLAYTNSSSRPAPPPTRRRERSPSPLARGRASERTFEDDERFRRERRYFEEKEDIDSVILPSSARRRPPPVIPSDADHQVTVERERVRVRENDRSPQRPPPPRPGQLIRRQSSLDTFDRRPARRAYDFERLDDSRDHRDPRTGAPIPLPRRSPREHSAERKSERYAERDGSRGRESTFVSEFDELRIDPGHYRPSSSALPRRVDDHERDYFRETEVVSSRREGESRSRSRAARRARSLSVSSEESEGGRNEYPKKGKTRIPARLVSERALIDLRYPFTKEGSTIVVQLALGQDNIDDVLRLSRDYKRNDGEVVESRKTKLKKVVSGEVIRERRREDYCTAPVVYQPAQLPPPPAPAPPCYTPAPVEMAPYTDYASVHIRDVSPAKSYTAGAFSTAPVTSTELVRARSRSRPASRPDAVIIDAGGPVMDYREERSVGPLAVVAVNDRHRSRHRSRHSRSHSHGDGALYARIHDHHDRHDHRYYYEERDYYESPSRELVRTERLSNGDIILYEEDIEVEVPRRSVRIEKDKKGRMSISVPKYRY